MFQNKRYIQYLDKNHNEILGSAGIWVFDQRFSNITIVNMVQKKYNFQLKAWQKDQRYIKPDYSFFDIKQCHSILESHKIGFNN